MHDDRLAVSVTDANGRVSRWGGDEPGAINVPVGLQFSTAMPGGFKDLTLTLGRRIDLDYPDLNLLDDVRVYGGGGGDTAFEGRVVQLPRSHGDTFSIQVGCVGHASHLRDDASFREIYVDRDLSRWGPNSAADTLANYGSYTVASPEIRPDATQSALVIAATAPWASTAKAKSIGRYNAQGIPIGSLYYAWKKSNTISASDTNWHWDADLTNDDVYSSVDSSGELRAAGPGTGTLTASAADRVFAAVVMSYASTGTVNGEEYAIYWTCLGVYGNHGLTKQGTESATTAKGFFASDVIANIVGRAAPRLNYTTGTGGSIQPTTFVIPQLAFPDPVSAEDAILEVNKYHLYEWGVYDNRTFFFRPADPNRLTWQARLSEGAHLDLEGDQADDVYNGVFVSYRDFDGVQKTVGPPGALADATDATLADTSSANPVNAHGYKRRWARLDLSVPTSQAGAIALGFVWLAQRANPARRGTITLRGSVQHPTIGQRQPVWKIRAGDWIRVSDHPADDPRRVIQTSYDHETRTLTANVGNDIAKLDAILERIGVGLVGVM